MLEVKARLDLLSIVKRQPKGLRRMVADYIPEDSRVEDVLQSEWMVRSICSIIISCVEIVVQVYDTRLQRALLAARSLIG